MTPLCATCRYFALAKSDPKTNTPIYGECRFNAPLTDGTIAFGELAARFGKFPLMMAHQWCGEWKPR